VSFTLASGRFSNSSKANHVLQSRTPLPENVRSAYVVGDPINPRPQRTTLIESFEASPQPDVDFLQQVAPGFCIGFIGPCQSFKRGPIDLRGLPINPVLVGAFSRHGCNCAHIKVVARKEDFLQQF